MPEGATRGVEGRFSGHGGRRRGALRIAAESVVRRLRGGIGARELRHVAAAAAVVQALENRTMLAADLQISEFMASNQRTLPHIDGNYYDWIEIHNAGDAPADLEGYKLTDDANQLDKWTFPDRTIPAGGYVVVFASSTRTPQPNELLATFELERNGEYLALVSPTGAIVSQFAPKYPNQEPDISYGADPDAAGKLRYFATPTPGARNARAEVVINEIHYDPDQKMELVEFVELHNPGSAAVDLTGATFSAGFTYTFPVGSILPAGGYLTLTENQALFQQKFGVAAFGQFDGTLSNEGEEITLENRGGGILDTVTYGAGFPWPTVGEAPGYSIELINPDFDNDIGGNWRALVPSTATETTLLPARSNWKYFKGTTEASNPVSDWRQPIFPAADGWSQGPGPIGYEPAGGIPMGTTLADMRFNYTSVFMRSTFQVDDPASISTLRLEALYDDGFNVWINGEHVYTQNLASAEMLYSDVAGPATEFNTYQTFSPKRPYSYLRQGTNTIAVQFHNTFLGDSSDAYFDARLIAVKGGTGVSPTPGRQNAVHANNAAPQMRQVTHTPNQPTSNAPVTITAKITDPEGVASVNLSYQIVDPGNYIPLDLLQGGVMVPNPAYSNPANWTSLAMRDDGSNGDATAGDGIYTAVLPPQLQQHRRLIRYRISAADNLGASITAPYAGDTVPNFTYFVYDGVPAWQGANQPGVTPVQTYDTNTLTSVPVYHLITQRQDHVNSQYLPGATMGQYGGDNYQWSGALVYDGVVYDHIHYRARGGVWRYAMGKNMWKFDFNRNHEFQARDEYGNPLETKWTKLNLGANIQQGNFGQRGEQGLFEHVGFKLFNLAGTATSKTAPIHFRIIENASQNGPTQSQYDDDFQGMYLAVEQLDGEFLDEHELPDGNLYKMEGGTGELNNLGPNGPADKSDLNAFRSTLLSNPSEQWIRDNVDLDQYYSYRAIVEAIHHYDIGAGKNYFWYRNPETGKWTQHAWDLDLTWTTTYEPGNSDPFLGPILGKPVFMKEYRNRLREIRDLMWNPEQVGRMLDDYAALVDKPGNSMVEADRAMWDYNPILVSGNVNLSKAGHGKFYESTALRTFRSFVDKLKQYVATRGAYIDSNLLTLAEENAAPRKATVTYSGPAGYPEDQLRFNTTGFVAGAPVGGEGVGTFAAMEWRISDVTPATLGTPQNYEIDAAWESGELTSFSNTITVPGTAVQDGRTYRVRVRFKDSNGRWGHWSDAHQFVAAQGNSLVRDSLRVTEVHYHPQYTPPAGSTYTKDDFEFIELKNTGTQQINLKGVEFGPGITYEFPNDLFVPAGGYVVLAKNPAAFATRYPGVTVAGTYAGLLADGGEEIVLSDAVGEEIQRFTYDDTGTGWHASTDGDGYSLTIVNEDAALPLWSDATNWRPSSVLNGTPGGDDSAIAPGTIIINEIATHRVGGADWIELRNTKAAPMNIGGWFLSDDPANLTKYKIAPNTTIGGNAYRVFTALDDFGAAFTLNELLGGRLYLSNASGQLAGSYRDSVDYGAAAPGVTIGWHAHTNGGDFTELASATLGAANAGPAIGPVVINEIMYNPLTIGASEYIELRNLTGAPVKLYDPANPQNTWQFTDGITFNFPLGAEIPAFGYVLVVPTDPDAFRATNDIHPNVPVFGPYTGNLGNGGEKVTLSRPGTPVGLTVPYYRVDRVEYANTTPWPTAPDGTGPALSKANSSAYGNDAANWSAENPGGSVGRENFDAAAPTVTIPEVGPGPVNSIRIVFSELVRGFDINDLQLTRDGVNVSLTATQTLTTIDGLTYVLGNLGARTSQPGEYVLRVVTQFSEVRDLAERPLAGGASRSFTVAASGLALTGTAGNDNWYLKRVGDVIHVWNNADGSGSRVSEHAMGTAFGFNALDGDDAVTIDLAGGNIDFGEFRVTGSSGDDVLRVINGDGRLLTVGELPSLDGERLDLGAADLKVTGGTVAAIDGLLKTARDGATRWQGPGVGTSAATSLTGLMAIQQGADALVKYTYNGDANGDGRVNADDYFRIDQGFLSQPANATYAQGDFNYDDRVNADDYFLIDQAFLGQGAQLGGAAVATSPVAATAALTTAGAPVEEPKKPVKRTRSATSLFSDVRLRPSARRAR